MPIKILSIKAPDIVKKTTSVTKDKRVVSLPVSKFSDVFDKTGILWNTSSEILEKITGEFSKEDLIKVRKLKQQYSSLSLIKVFEKHLELCMKNFPEIISKITKESKTEGKKEVFAYNPCDVNMRTKKTAKDLVMKLFVLKQLMHKNSSRMVGVPYSEWFDTNLGVQNKTVFNTDFMHPVDKILKICGDYYADEMKKIAETEKVFETKTVQEIWKEKEIILNKIYKIFEKTNPDFMGNFSDREMKKLKELSVKYTALNNCQKQKGYFSKNIETLLFSRTKKIEKGEYIDGVGLVTDKMVVDNKPVFIVFSDDYKRHGFKMYDENIYKKYEDFLQKLPKEVSLEDLNKLNSNAQAFITQSKNALISEIHFEVIDKIRLKQLIKIEKTMSSKINDLIEKNDELYFISSYRNYKKKEFPSAAKLLGVRMLKLLKEKNGYPLFLRAQAYGSNHSPVSLYLRVGFEPISKTQEQVRNIMDANHSEYINKPLYMYAENFDKIGKIIDIMSRAYQL